jgi:hypothetical protein
MGTKNNPGKFDCYEKAEPDEPRFTLIGRDRFASGLVKLWAAFKEGDIYQAISEFYELSQLMCGLPVDLDQIEEAINCANEMQKYKDVHK